MPYQTERFYRVLKALFITCMLLGWLPLAGEAQTLNPQRQWQQLYATPPQGFSDGAPLSPTRFVRIGAYLSGTVRQPVLMFSRPTGDTLSRVITPVPPRYSGLITLITEPDSGFVVIAGQNTPAGNYGLYLLHFDTLGNRTWEQPLPPPAGLSFSTVTGIALPDGYLLQFDLFDRNFIPYGHLARLDKRGRIVWQQAMPAQNAAQLVNAYTLVACADGSYVMCNGDPYHYSVTGTKWDIDYWLARYTSQGVQLHSGYAGRRGDYDKPYHLRTTADGGFALVGSTRLNGPVYADALTWSHFVKLDSLFRTEWAVKVSPSTTSPGSGSEYTFVEPLANGHYLVSGYDPLPGANPPTTAYRVGVLAEIAPPTQLGDTIGQIVGQWQDTRAFGQRVFIDSTGTGYLFGSGTGRGQWAANTYLARYSGLGQPQAQNLCARPPVLGAATWLALGGRADSLGFTLEAATTTAGPRYGEISRVTWDFGDGSPPALGWQVQHTFASPQPVRVRVCAMNNLWCQTCTDLYPFGIVTATPQDHQPLQVSVWPNPSSDGRFTLRLSAAGTTTLNVTDALGRVVWRGENTRAETVVDLGRCAPGVYSLRGVAADGRSFTRRLVR